MQLVEFIVILYGNKTNISEILGQEKDNNI